MKKIIAFVLSVALLTSCSNNQTYVTDVCTLSEQTIYRNCVLGGTIDYASKPETVKTDLTGGVVDKVFVSVGDHVEVGDTICTVDTSSFESEIKELKENIANADEKIRLDKDRCQEAIDYARKSMEIELAHLNDTIESQKAKLEEFKTLCRKTEDEYAQALSLAEELEQLLESADSAVSAESYAQQYSQASSDANNKYLSIQSYNEMIRSLESSISELEYAYDKAETDGENAVSQAEYEMKQIDTGSSDDDKRRLESLESMMSDPAVTAPVSGYITQLMIYEGMTLAENRVAEISSSDELCVKITVPDEYILSISSGTKVTFSASSMNNKEYSGTVKKISEHSSEEGFSAVVEIDKTDQLMAGMTASVTVTLEGKTVSAVPVEAVHKDKDGKSYVFTAVPFENESYTVEKIYFTSGISNSEYIEVVDHKIDENTYIILTNENYTEGQTVNVKTEDSDDGSS